ncbi:copper-binding protein [Macromonas nakdongensis]|uniref:copper-binding protein n=1 Tax=Macromonas nakdongensis TaxID=1843082 RepID=UPI000C34D71A|nr:copper-binding protein [Macromonas nakdongensis]
MTPLQQMLAIAALTLGTAVPIGGLAQTATDHHAHAAAPASADLTEGEVKKVDLAAGKVTIKHGPIASLDMPGMTMVFAAQDPAALAQLQPGDKIRFQVTLEGKKMVVSDIQSAP